jgi:hypothetical protein
MAIPQVQNDPIYSLPHLYISGMNISVASTTVIAIAPGQARDSNDNIDMPIGFPNLEGFPAPILLANSSIPAALFLNSAVVGANGLDAGALAASTNYVIYLIGDSRNYKPVAGLISLSSNAFPLLPLGYDSYRMLGFVSTDGSTHFTAASVLNASSSKGFYLQPEVSVLSAGNATSFTAIDLSTPIPTTTDPFVIAILDVLFTPAAIGDLVQFRPTGSSATAGLVSISGIAAGVPQQQYIQVICGVASSKPEIDYKVTSSSDAVTVLVNGYILTLS